MALIICLFTCDNTQKQWYNTKKYELSILKNAMFKN